MAKCRSSLTDFEIPVSEWKHMTKMRGKEELTPVEKLFWYKYIQHYSLCCFLKLFVELDLKGGVSAAQKGELS